MSELKMVKKPKARKHPSGLTAFQVQAAEQWYEIAGTDGAVVTYWLYRKALQELAAARAEIARLKAGQE